MSPSATHTSHVIIGAGAFGAAAALSLTASDPSASIVLIDRTPYPCTLAASHDYQKAVRADYGTKFYMDLGLKARTEWVGNPFYSQFYHPSKIIFVEKPGGAEQMVENFRELGYTSCYTSTPEVFRDDHPLFADMDFNEVTALYVNPDAAWVEATPCIRAMIDAAVKLGVDYVEATISKLLFNDEGDCLGVQLADGKRIMATKTILAAGANVPKILADSAPQRLEMQTGNRLSGAAIMTGVVKLTEEQAIRLKDMPIVAHRVAKSSGEGYPVVQDNIFKVLIDSTFTRKWTHSESGLVISTPPPETDERQSECPQVLRDELKNFLRCLLGKEADGFNISSYRMCWDAITPDQDFIISPHPACCNNEFAEPTLYLATGGSFHGWKFLPVLGAHIVDMLNGNMDEETSKRWSWDRAHATGGAHAELFPGRDWKDLFGDD